MAGVQRNLSQSQQQLALAITRHNAGNSLEAERLCRQILERQPQHPDALHLLGIIHAQRNDFAIAEQLTGSAAQGNPGNAAFRNSHGNVLDSLGRHEEAIRVLQKAIKLQKIFPEAYNNLGIALQHNGAIIESIAAFRQAIRQRPEYSAALCNLGNALKQQGDYPAAIDAYRAALKIVPGYFSAINNLGIALLEAGRHEEAGGQFDRCLTMRPGDADIHLNRGIACFRQRRYAEAMGDFEQVLRLAPNYPDIHLHIAKAAYELGDHELAMQQYLAELERGQNRHEALSGLSAICFARRLDEDYWALSNAALAEPGISELQRNEVLVYQAIKSWLEKQPLRCAEYLSQSASIRAMTASGLDNVRFLQAYHLYLEALCRYREDHPQLYAEGNERMAYLVGDSHSLAAHGCRIEQCCRIEARLVVGAKAWHIANRQPNRFKSAVREAIASLPDGCEAVFAFGEIDCRPDEGILVFLKKHPQELGAYLSDLAASYVARILEATLPRNIRTAFCGVPVPGYDLGSLPEEERNRLLEIIAGFNLALQSVSAEAGCGFVDVYAASRAEPAEGRTHLDGYHVQPLALARLIGEALRA